MKPSPEVVLNQAFAKIALEIGPALPPGYGQSSATTLGVLLLMIAQEFTRAADVRARENEHMRQVFKETVGRLPAPLAERLQSAQNTCGTELSIGALDRENAEFKKHLIALHEWADEVKDAALQRRILLFLRDAAAARVIQLPAM